MTKRLLALFLVCILAIPILALPASATTTDNSEAYLERLVEYFTEKANTGTGMTPEWLRDFSSTMGTYFNRLQNAVTEAISDFNTDFDQFVVGLGNLLNSIEANLLDRLDSIKTGITDIYESITTTISNYMAVIAEDVRDILNEVIVLGDKLTTLVTGSSEHQAEAEEQKQQAATQATEFEEYLDILQEATRPEYEDIQVGVTDITGGESIGTYTSMLKSILNQSAFTSALFMACMFSAISFVIFGKR